MRYGQYAGRLIQQYSGYVRQSNGSESFQAWSVYSDDHGSTWHMGVPVGSGMDENKVVELSDGRIMLNSRDSGGSKVRKVTVSTDGGRSYGPVQLDSQLIDPTNNASITRLFPDAAQGSADAKKLMFTNSASQSARENVSARISCDDGTTWTGVRRLHPGPSAYSTGTRLADGKLGVFYEVDYVSDMRVAVFDDAWLSYVCAPVSTPALTMTAGTTAQVPVTVTNQEATALTGGQATVLTPTGWAAPRIAVPDLAPGASVTVDVPLTAPSTANGGIRLDAAFLAADGRSSQYGFVATVTGATTIGMTITGTPASRDVVTNPYVAGDPLPYSLTVRSTSNVQTNSVPTASNLEVGFLPPSAPNCRYLKLAAGASYTCTPSHQLTTDEIARGWFRPTATFEVTSTADATATRTVTFTGAPVVLRDPLTIAPTVDISGSRSDASRDLSTMPYTVGEQVPYSFRVVSTTPYIITVTPASGPFGPFVPPGTGNCRWSNLAALGAYTCATPRHTVTQDELDAGFFVADTGWTLSASGRASVSVPVAGGEVDLKVRAPELAGTVTPVWVDVDGDRYASVGDQVVVTRTLGNAGTTSLTGVVAPGGLATPALALEQSVTDTVTLTLDAAMLQSPTLVVDGFTATAANGSRSVSLTVDPVTFALDHKPSMPTSSPTITRVDYTDLVPPVELGLDQKYRIGSEMVLQNLPYGQWYHLSLNKNSQDLGWFFPTVDDEISVILPQGTKNGRDDVVVRRADGSTYTWGTYIVTPKG